MKRGQVVSADRRRSDAEHESSIAKFFDVTGGIAGLGCVLAGIILFVAIAGYDHKVVAAAVAVFLFVFGSAAGIVRNLRRVRIVAGVVFVTFLVLSVVAAVVLSRG